MSWEKNAIEMAPMPPLLAKIIGLICLVAMAYGITLIILIFLSPFFDTLGFMWTFGYYIMYFTIFFSLLILLVKNPPDAFV